MIQQILSEIEEIIDSIQQIYENIRGYEARAGELEIVRTDFITLRDKLGNLDQKLTWIPAYSQHFERLKHLNQFAEEIQNQLEKTKDIIAISLTLQNFSPTTVSTINYLSRLNNLITNLKNLKLMCSLIKNEEKKE